MSAGMRSALLAAVGLLLLGCAYLDFRTHSLSQTVDSLQGRTTSSR